MTNYATGQVLGARLELLVRAANYDLPIVSAAFARVVANVQTTQSDVSGAFWRPSEFGGGAGADKHVAVVSDFAGVILDCVKNAEHSVELTAEALRLAAQEYARSDHAAGDELKNLMSSDYAQDGDRKVPIPDIKLPL